MPDIERLEERLSAVERTVIDGEHDFDELADLAEVIDRLERIEGRLEEIESRVADLEGRTDSMRGYITNVDSINESVEKQSAAALAAVESLERRVDDIGRRAADDDASEGQSIADREAGKLSTDEESNRRGKKTDGVDQYRPTTGPDRTAVPIDEDAIAETVDNLVEGTDRKRSGIGRAKSDGDSPERASDGSDAEARTDNRSGGVTRANDRTWARSRGSIPEADPDEINRRYGSRPRPAPAQGEPDNSDDADDADGSSRGLLASLTSKLP